MSLLFLFFLNFWVEYCLIFRVIFWVPKLVYHLQKFPGYGTEVVIFVVASLWKDLNQYIFC